MAKQASPEVITLSNGIPVILQHVDGMVASTYWWNRVGSADELPFEAGFAHFLEHMLFKDAAAKETGKASTGQMARAIESLGGELNAYTSFDQTVYHVTCAEQHWEKVLDEWGVIARPQKFLKRDFDSEREVILEELRKNEDSPDRQLFQNLFSSTFAKHPYGKPVIGYAKTLKAAKVGQLEHFYKKHYVSANMGLVVVGPLADPARKKNILKKIESLFGSKVHKEKESAKPNRPEEAPLRTRASMVSVPFAVKSPTLSFAFRVPSLFDEDVPALDVLAGVMGMGELSRLHQQLFYKTSLATAVGAGLYVPKDPGMLYFSAEYAKSDQTLDIFKEILSELKRISQEGPTTEELERIIVHEEAERLYATQTTDGMAGRLGFLQFVLGNLHFDHTYLAKLKAIKPDDVRAVARKYLTSDRMGGAILFPKEEKKFDVQPLLALAEAELPKGASTKVAKVATEKQIGLPVQSGKLHSGLSWSVLERPHSNAFSIHVSALGGLRLEREEESGIAHLMADTWNKGTTLKTAKQISQVIEGAAADLSGFAGRNSIGLECTGLVRDWKKLTDLLTEVMTEPAFPEDEIAHSKRVTEEQLKSIDDHSSQLCSKYFMETLFEQHPYRRMVLGKLETLPTFDSSKLKALHRQWIQPSRLHVSVVGAISQQHVQEWLESLDKKLSMFTLGVSQLGESPVEEGLLKAPRWIERKLGREQVHIIVGGLGISLYDENRYAMRLLQTLLGGQSGRLFIELREKKSLAYTVAPVSFEGLEKGYVGTYIGCSPHKQKEAIDGIRTVLETLAKKGPTAAEMKRAKEFFLGRRAMELQSDSALSAHYGLKSLYGISSTEDADIKKKIESIRDTDLKKVCQKFLVEPHMVTAAVG